MKIDKNTFIAIVGLGYVGLPLAVEFGKKYRTIGFDINRQRVSELQRGLDHTLEVEPEELSAAMKLTYSADVEQLREANVFIVTVPTPIDEHKQPDLSPLRKASEMLGRVIKRGDVVIYESTVYPGATEEYCVPIIERTSGLMFNRDFFVGYSPERINPGDKQHRLTTILKVTSGSTPDTARFVNDLYASVVLAGTWLAESIKVAEAAKVIENTQRDLNIALMNELAIIFEKMGIDTEDVLRAAGTKWNFLPFRPGLVGGHCIGVDPYYLTHKAESLGYYPQVILAGRRINDNMACFAASRLIKQMIRRKIEVDSSKVLILGLTFKENCPDLRNTKVIDMINELKDYQVMVDVCDPWADAHAARKEYGIDLVETPDAASYDAIVIAVAHRQFSEMGAAGLRKYGKDKHVMFDLKYVFSKDESDFRL